MLPPSARTNSAMAIGPVAFGSLPTSVPASSRTACPARSTSAYPVAIRPTPPLSFYV